MGAPGLIKRSSSRTKKTAKPGSWPSRLVRVSDAEGYVKGDAFWLHYELECNGGVIEYSEFFINDTANERTDKLDQYLQENGVKISSYEELVGLQEVLTLEKQARNGRSYLNVGKREFVAW